MPWRVDLDWIVKVCSRLDFCTGKHSAVSSAYYTLHALTFTASLVACCDSFEFSLRRSYITFWEEEKKISGWIRTGGASHGLFIVKGTMVVATSAVGLCITPWTPFVSITSRIRVI